MIEEGDKNNKGNLDINDFKKMVFKKPKKEKEKLEEEIIKNAYNYYKNKEQNKINIKEIAKKLEKEFDLDINLKKILDNNEFDKTYNIDFEEFKSLLIK